MSSKWYTRLKCSCVLLVRVNFVMRNTILCCVLTGSNARLRHQAMASPQVADRGDGPQVERVAAKVLNKESRTAEKGR